MRGAFVVRLQRGGHTGPLQGSVEEVDTGRQARFCSDEELLLFLRERFAATRESQQKEESSYERNEERQ
jgi:hypothetical protein